MTDTIIHEAVQILSGTDNKYSKQYLEAAKEIESSSKKSFDHLKSFMTSIEQVAGKVQNKQISASKGSLTKLSNYDSISTVLNFLTTKNKSPIVTNLDKIQKALSTNASKYSAGYDKQIRLIILEYESAVYMLITGLAYAMARIDITIKDNGTVSTALKTDRSSHVGLMDKTISSLASQISSPTHSGYLSALIEARSNHKINEAMIFEEGKRSISDTLDIVSSLYDGVVKLAKFGIRSFSMIYKTMFGIIPLIRAVLYLRYKRKADTILSLEQQAQFIRMNIEQLQNIKTMDNTKKQEIIKKQQAAATSRLKYAEKLRAQLAETDKEASAALKEDEPSLQKTSEASDEFILESGFGSETIIELSTLFESPNWHEILGSYTEGKDGAVYVKGSGAGSFQVRGLDKETTDKLLIKLKELPINERNCLDCKNVDVDISNYNPSIKCKIDNTPSTDCEKKEIKK